MKRFLLVFALAAALLCLMATPALAGPASAAGYRMPEKTAYIFAYLDGSWFEVTDAAAGVFVGHWGPRPDPIPQNYDIAFQIAWKSPTYGLIQTLPLDMLVTLSIPQLGVDLSQEQAKAYWSGPFLWDDYWVNAVTPILPFNPKLGAQVYCNQWLPLLTGPGGLAGRYLNAEGKLPRGAYTVSYTETWPRPYTDLEALYDDLGNQVNSVPTHFTPGSWGTSYSFKVGPPKK